MTKLKNIPSSVLEKLEDKKKLKSVLGDENVTLCIVSGETIKDLKEFKSMNAIVRFLKGTDVLRKVKKVARGGDYTLVVVSAEAIGVVSTEVEKADYKLSDKQIGQTRHSLTDIPTGLYITPKMVNSAIFPNANMEGMVICLN